MTQKKTNYWDQIFTTQNQDQEETVAENEDSSPLDFHPASASQEQERHVREILFSEDPEPPHDLTEAAVNADAAQEMERTAVSPAVSQTAGTEFGEDAQEAAENGDEDDFFGWTLSTKTYTHLSLEGREPEVTEELASEECEVETVEGGGSVCETAIAAEADDAALTEEDVDAGVLAAEAECAAPADADAADETSVPILSEDGFLSRVLDRYERPVNSGFGFGLLDDEEDDADASTAAEAAEAADDFFAAISENSGEESASEELDECEESADADLLKKPDGLDPWASLAFDLGIPVTLPEKNTKKETPAAFAEPARKDGGTVETKASADFHIVDLEDDDFVSSADVFDEPKVQEEKKETSRRSRRERSRRNVEEFQAPQLEANAGPLSEETDEAVAVPPRSRRRRRSGVVETVAIEEKSAAIGGIMAGVVASKMQETEKGSRRSGRKNRTEEETISAPARRERARRTRRPIADEMPEMEESHAGEMEFIFQMDEPEPVFEEEREVPNGARSRRRRRSQREKMERGRLTESTEDAVMFEEEMDELPVVPKKRSRRDVRARFEQVEDDFQENAWNGSFMEEDEDEEDERVSRSRRSRRSRRTASERETARYRGFEEDDEHYPADDEEHVFTEVRDEADDDDDVWETDFSQHDVPGWRYMIDFIVNTNLKARRREPSSLAGSINRMAKRGGKRK